MDGNDVNIDTSNYEFLDFGCSGGESLKKYGELFNVENKGLGLDIDPRKVELTKAEGFDALVCDIAKIELKTKISFGIMSHFLEHVPSIKDVEKIVIQACSIIDDFLLIRQPYFDADTYLFTHGLKFYWSNWKGHPNHMTLLEFHNIFMPMVLDNQINKFSIYGLSPVSSSIDPCIHNLDSEVDQHSWDSNKHSFKKTVNFSIPIYKEVLVIVDLNGNNTDRVESLIQAKEKLFKLF